VPSSQQEVVVFSELMVCDCAKFVVLSSFLQLKTETKDPRQKPDSISLRKTELEDFIAHNYSTQSLNSTQLSKQKLMEILDKVSWFSVLVFSL
jgi:hypothetical protein